MTTTQAVHDVYALNLATSGKLKLRAKGLLAVDTEDALFDACVLLHEAARIQRLAVDSLPHCAPVTRLASLVEECWCYVEGRDMPRAAEVWGDLLKAQQLVDKADRHNLLARLLPRFQASQQTFATLLQASPLVRSFIDVGSLDGAPASERNKLRKQLVTVLDQFPGTVGFWWLRFLLAEADQNREAAWAALSKARLLTPHNHGLLAISLLVSTWALPKTDAEVHVGSVRGPLDHLPAEVGLLYAHAEIALAKNASRTEQKQRWKAAREAVITALAKASTEATRRSSKATQLLLDELLAGREPTLDVLYLSGLGEIAASASPNAAVIDLLAERLRRTPFATSREAALEPSSACGARWHLPPTGSAPPIP